MRCQLALPSANGLQQRQPPIGAHEHHLEDRQGKDRVKGVPLRDVPRGAGGAVEAVLNLTGEHGNESEYAAQQGRLASTVWPHQGKAFAAFDSKREVLEHDPAVVPETHISEREERTRHYPPCTALSMVRIL